VHGLPGRHVDQVAAGLREGARDLDRIVAGDAAFLPVGRRDAHRHRLLVRPLPCAWRGSTSSGKRRRFSNDPPYSSVRVLVSGEMKLASR
jgi:hypothetical protein